MRWASYVVTAVGYDHNGHNIRYLEIRIDHGTSIGPATIWTREQVVDAIDEGYTFVTSYRHNGSWVFGANVSIVELGRDRYLRTAENRVRADNLGELPVLTQRRAG